MSETLMLFTRALCSAVFGYCAPQYFQFHMSWTKDSLCHSYSEWAYGLLGLRAFELSGFRAFRLPGFSRRPGEACSLLEDSGLTDPQAS